jgi:hypothetical protein
MRRLAGRRERRLAVRGVGELQQAGRRRDARPEDLAQPAARDDVPLAIAREVVAARARRFVVGQEAREALTFGFFKEAGRKGSPMAPRPAGPARAGEFAGPAGSRDKKPTGSPSSSASA